MTVDEMIEQAYRDHYSAIRGKVLQLTRDEELAADVSQETFLRLLSEGLAGRTPDNVVAWLYRTSSNLVVSRARHRAVAYRYAPRLVRDEQPAQPDAIAVLHEDHEEIAAVLARLSRSDRTALVLAAHGASGREIASHLGRTPMATRTLLSRARGRLRAASAQATAGTPA